MCFQSCLNFDLQAFLEAKDNRSTLPAASLLSNKDLTQAHGRTVCVHVCACAFSSLSTVSTQPVIFNQLMSPGTSGCMFSNSEKPKIERQTGSNDATVHFALERVKFAFFSNNNAFGRFCRPLVSAA